MIVTTYKWVCTNTELCEEIDSQLKESLDYLAHLSKYRNENTINGLECLSLERRLSNIVRELKLRRSSLWRRIKIETEQEEDNAS